MAILAYCCFASNRLVRGERDWVRKTIDGIFDLGIAFGHAAGISGGGEKLNRATKKPGV